MSDDPLAARPPLRIGPSHMAAAVDQLSSRITELEAENAALRRSLGRILKMANRLYYGAEGPP
jgi:hypothetical protein